MHFSSVASEVPPRCCTPEAAALGLSSTHLVWSLLPQQLCFGFSLLCCLTPFKRQTSRAAKPEERILAALGSKEMMAAGESLWAWVFCQGKCEGLCRMQVVGVGICSLTLAVAAGGLKICLVPAHTGTAGQKASGGIPCRALTFLVSSWEQHRGFGASCCM